MTTPKNRRILTVGECSIEYLHPGSATGRAVNKVVCCCVGYNSFTNLLPNQKVIARLCKEYLGSDLYLCQKVREQIKHPTMKARVQHGYIIEIDSGINKEKRSAFLGALQANRSK